MPKYEKIEKVEAQPPAGPASQTSVETPVETKVEVLLITFDRWFASKGFKPHWKAGMAAFTDTSSRKTAAEWEAAFKAY
jgi:hypothetical protein